MCLRILLLLVPPRRRRSRWQEEEQEEEESDEEEQQEAGAKTKKPPKTPKSEEAVSEEAKELGELFAKLALEKGFTPKTNKSAIKYATDLLINKECACGVKLTGKYVDLGVCSKCSAKKPSLKCVSCEKRLIGAYKVEGGLCKTCTETEERKQKNAEKEAAKMK